MTPEEMFDKLSEIIKNNNIKKNENEDFIVIDDKGSRLNKENYYKMMYFDVKTLQKEFKELEETSLQYYTDLSNIKEIIAENNKKLQEIKNNMPIKWTARLSKTAKLSDNIMGSFKLILFVFLIVYFLLTIFPDISALIVPNTNNSMEKKIDLLLKNQNNPLFPVPKKDDN